ncbi:MAG TPA: SLBB domain-containing protein [Ignavibacteriaceae bacterium]|nr:SLBB domain-containing protein [Ignavibacteriaceae bacterium]
MANSKIILFLFLILISSFSVAQILPTYSERSFNSFSDSSFSKYMQASEGVIDPEEYKVGPGDNIFISVSGIEERDFNLLINHEGFLYIPRIGAVDLRNKSLAEAKEIIRASLEKNFRNVDIYIALGEVRKIKVSLVGDVYNQSSLVLNSNSRLQDVLKVSSGINPTSDLRNIKIISKDGTTGIFDLLSFFRKGDMKQNPYLKDGDIVLIEKVDKIISILGQIRYPATYEFKEGETLKDLIDLAGGLAYKARKDTIEIIRFAEDGINQYSKYFSYKYIQQNTIELKYSDLIVVRELSTYYDEQWITIDGEVKFPGVYRITKDKTTLTEVINEAGGFLEDASLIDATLYRNIADTSYDSEFERIKLIPRADMTDDEYDYLKAKSRQRVGKVVVDFESLFTKNQLSEDLILKRLDKISIPEKKNYITIIGQVVSPGSIIFNENLKVQDYIQLAGGFSWRALEGDVRIIKTNTGGWVEEDDVEELEPGDTIWVLEDPPGPKFWDVFTTSLTILGQVAAILAASIAVIIATR